MPVFSQVSVPGASAWIMKDCAAWLHRQPHQSPSFHHSLLCGFEPLGMVSTPPYRGPGRPAAWALAPASVASSARTERATARSEEEKKDIGILRRWRLRGTREQAP